MATQNSVQKCLGQQFFFDAVLDYLVGPVPAIPRPNSRFDTVHVLAQTSKSFKAFINSSTRWRSTYNIVATAAIDGYSNGCSQPGISRVNFDGEQGLLQMFSNPPTKQTSFLPLIGMLFTSNCYKCGTMTNSASPILLRRICKHCAAKNPSALLIPALKAKEICLLTEKDVKVLNEVSIAGSISASASKLYSAEEVANLCLSKYKNIEEFKAEVERKRLASTDKYNASQSSNKPQKKPSKIHDTKHFDGTIESLDNTSTSYNTFPLGFLIAKDLFSSYEVNTAYSLNKFVVQGPCAIGASNMGTVGGSFFGVMCESIIQEVEKDGKEEKREKIIDFGLGEGYEQLVELFGKSKPIKVLKTRVEGDDDDHFQVSDFLSFNLPVLANIEGKADAQDAGGINFYFHLKDVCLGTCFMTCCLLMCQTPSPKETPFVLFSTTGGETMGIPPFGSPGQFRKLFGMLGLPCSVEPWDFVAVALKFIDNEQIQDDYDEFEPADEDAWGKEVYSKVGGILDRGRGSGEKKKGDA